MRAERWQSPSTDPNVVGSTEIPEEERLDSRPHAASRWLFGEKCLRREKIDGVWIYREVGAEELAGVKARVELEKRGREEVKWLGYSTERSKGSIVDVQLFLDAHKPFFNESVKEIEVAYGDDGTRKLMVLFKSDQVFILDYVFPDGYLAQRERMFQKKEAKKRARDRVVNPRTTRYFNKSPRDNSWRRRSVRPGTVTGKREIYVGLGKGIDY